MRSRSLQTDSNVIMKVIFLFSAFFLCLGSAAGNLLYECRDFDPKQPSECGINTNPAHQWSIHDSKSLPKILANVVDIINVLYMNSTNSLPAEYHLNGPSPYELSTVNAICVQYAFIASDNCHNDRASGSVCDTNVTLRNPVGQVYKAERSITFDDGGWTLNNFQFDLSPMSSTRKSSLQVHLHGYIFGGNTKSSSLPYIGIKFIRVMNSTCTNRIGPRKSFWIAVMIIFSCVTGYTFVHIAIQHIMYEHKKRTTPASPRAP